MIGRPINLIKLTFFLALLGMLGCVKDRNFNIPNTSCDSELNANTTYREVKSLYQDKTIQIQEDFIIEGYVISSDEMGNFFSVLHFQDSPMNPTQGFQIEIDLRDSYLFYPLGTKFFIKLKGLYLGKSKGVFKIGGAFTSFGNLSVGRLPAAIVRGHIFASCDVPVTIQPTHIKLSELNENLINTLIQINDAEIIKENQGFQFAVEFKETERTLVDCGDNEIVLINSGYSDFQADILPEKRGSITAILVQDNTEYKLIIRSLLDINFNQKRCDDLIDEFTSPNILISELADPENNTKARFVEIYNSGSQAISLKGWSFRRYTNANIDISSVIDLSGLTIASMETIVISPNETVFETVYGFLPDLAVGTNSPADSNGDDNFELVDPFGVIIDVYGRIGEDGTNTDHEFEDGRAVRNILITKGNASYVFSEWIIYNDTGNAETINQPQIAPKDFTPGSRN